MSNSSDNSRSANYTILGFRYQLLLTQKEIFGKLDNDASALFTIEGIEDLDVVSSQGNEFQQYKYYENTKVTLSKIQKALAYLYKTWKNNRQFSYGLFVYEKEKSIKSLSKEDISKALMLNDAKKILNEIVPKEELDDFYKCFSFKQVEKYEIEENNVVELISEKLHKNKEIIRILYLPLVEHYLYDIAVRKTKEERTISILDFKNFLEGIGSKTTKSFIKSWDDDIVLAKAIVKRMKNIYSSDSHTYSYVLRFGSIWKNKINASWLMDIVKLFAYPNNKITNQPVTFLFDLDMVEINALKKKMLFNNLEADIIMNDGYENINFRLDFFKRDILLIANKNGYKYKELSYNYRLATIDNGDLFLSNSDKLDKFIFNFDVTDNHLSTEMSDFNDKMMNFYGYDFGFIKMVMEGLRKK